MKRVIWVLAVLAMGLLFSKKGFATAQCRDIEQRFCIQTYVPVWCVSLSVAGKTLKKPLYTKASNACIAFNQIQKKACDTGLDWKRLDEEEIHCVVLSK